MADTTPTPEQAQPRPKIDLEALAKEILALMKEDLRHEAERCGKIPVRR